MMLIKRQLLEIKIQIMYQYDKTIHRMIDHDDVMKENIK